LLISSLARGREDSEVLLSSLGQVWVRGAPVNWPMVDGADMMPTIPAPPTAANGATLSVPNGAPAPTTLFNAQIDHAQVSSTLAKLRQGHLSKAEALTSIQSSLGQDAGGAP